MTSKQLQEEILNLKRLLRKNSGNVPLDLHFYSKNVKVGKILINKNWGVKHSEKLLNDIAAVEGIEKVYVHKKQDSNS